MTSGSDFTSLKLPSLITWPCVQHAHFAGDLSDKLHVVLDDDQAMFASRG